MNRKQKTALYGEIGRFFIDFAKYVATGVIITTLLKDFEGQSLLIYTSGSILVMALLLMGLFFIKLKEE